jgi:transketolase
MMVVAPGDPVETRLAVHCLATSPGPAYLRLGKAQEPIVHQQLDHLEPGQVVRVREGRDVALVSTGGMLPVCMDAAHQLAQCGVDARVLSMPFLAPVDAESLAASLRHSRAILTAEEHGGGGLAAIVAELLATRRLSIPFRPLYVPRDHEHTVGDQQYLRALHGLDAAAIAQQAQALLQPQDS